MKKVIRTVKNAIRKAINVFMPYLIKNEQMQKPHYAWTWSGAMEWVKCYDSEMFGPTYVMDLHGNMIALKR